MSEEEPTVATALELLDFAPQCSAMGCVREAAWSYECVYSCGMGGLMCEPHHETFAGRAEVRRCGRCNNVAPFRNLVLFRALGGAA